MTNRKRRVAHSRRCQLGNRETPVVNVSSEFKNAVKVNTETIIDMDIWTDMMNAFGDPFAKTL